jgi:integrase
MEEIGRLGVALDAADIDPAYADGFRLIALTSCRPGEIFSLRTDQVDLEGEVIRLQRNAKSAKTKTRRARHLPITGAMKAILTARMGEVEDGTQWLFPATRGAHLNCWDEAWRKVRELAQVEGRCYDLRHTVGTQLAERGTNQTIIMSIMGHRQLSTSQRYMHAGIDSTRAAMESVSVGIGQALGTGVN